MVCLSGKICEQVNTVVQRLNCVTLLDPLPTAYHFLRNGSNKGPICLNCVTYLIMFQLVLIISAYLGYKKSTRLVYSFFVKLKSVKHAGRKKALELVKERK